MSRPQVTIVWSDTAKEALARVGSRTLRQKIFDKVDGLRTTPEPESLRKPLQDELYGLFRLTHGRYRIIYRVTRQRSTATEQLTVGVALVGIRKEGDKSDVYRLAAKLKSQGRL